MAEIKTPLIELQDDEFLITYEHTHSDILRHVVADIGIDEALFLLTQMKEKTDCQTN